MPQAGFEPAHADWHSLGDSQLNHQTIWTVAQLWLLCFDMDIFANNSIRTEIEKSGSFKIYRYFLLYLLVFEFVRSMSWS